MDENLEIPGLRSSSCSSRSLQRLQAGELADDEAGRVRAHAASCPRCGPALAGLEREAEAFQREVPFEGFERAVLAKKNPRSLGRVARPLGLAIAAGVAVVVFAGPLRTVIEPPSPTSRIKGSSTLELHVGGTGVEARLARDGERLAAGERVRVAYRAAGRRYLLVLSVDEAGIATPLYPESGRSLSVGDGNGSQLMPDSLELTGQGKERFVALFSDEPIAVEAALSAASRELARAGSLERMGPLGLGGDESSMMVVKAELTNPLSPSGGR